MSNQTSISRREMAVATALGVLAVAVPARAEAKEPPASLEALKAVKEAHNKAFAAQDLKGVLATFSPRAIVMGTTPGEMWQGHEAISDAYRHLFADFDPGAQHFENLYTNGKVGSDMAWVMAVSKVTMTKGGKKKEFGLNMSLAFEKIGGKWLISAMHHSNLAAAKA